MNNKIIPYWKIKAVNELKNEIRGYENLIRKFRDEERVIKKEKNIPYLSFEDFAILISKYKAPKTNEFYINQCKIRINILKSEDIKGGI